MHNRHARKEMMQFNGPVETGKSSPGAKDLNRPESVRPVFELDKQGLRLGDRSLTKTTIIPELTKVFGAPTRTNQVDTANRNVYAYDKQGLLVYLDKNGLAEMVVLDFSGLDGVVGAAQPCRGELIVACEEMN